MPKISLLVLSLVVFGVTAPANVSAQQTDKPFDFKPLLPPRRPGAAEFRGDVGLGGRHAEPLHHGTAAKSDAGADPSRSGHAADVPVAVAPNSLRSSDSQQQRTLPTEFVGRCWRIVTLAVTIAVILLPRHYRISD